MPDGDRLNGSEIRQRKIIERFKTLPDRFNFAADSGGCVSTMPRYGFGEKTGESEKAGLAQFAEGHVDVSDRAFKYASSQYPSLPPAGAVGLTLAAEVAGVDLGQFGEAEVDVDWQSVHSALTELDGIGESTADDILETVQEAVSSA